MLINFLVTVTNFVSLLTDGAGATPAPAPAKKDGSAPLLNDPASAKFPY